jgi:required for meiotic nuclear division protein 1
LTADIPGDGMAVLLRYGAVVLFGAATAAIDSFVASLLPLVTAALAVPERDDARLLVPPEAEQPIDLAGNIVLREKTIERLQMVADSLSKSVVLSHHETRIAEIFGGIEPLAAVLREKDRAGARSKELLRYTSRALKIRRRAR